MTKRLLVGLCVAFNCAVAQAQVVPPTDLGLPDNSSPRIVNATGQIAGTSVDGRGFWWSAATGIIPLGSWQSWPMAINASGRVVGAYFYKNALLRAFVWDPQTRQMMDLVTLGGNNGRALAINDAGYVAGRARLPNGQDRAVVWSPSGVITDLGTFGGTFSEATAINARGQVVGTATFPGNGVQHAFMWDPETRVKTDLGVIGGPDSRSFAFAISDNGQVVGESGVGGTPNWHHAFSWTKTGGIVDLGTLGGPMSKALAVNAAGMVVGSSDVNGSREQQHAFAWTQSGGMNDLGTLGGVNSAAFAVNAKGQIAGFSNPADSDQYLPVVWSSAGVVTLGTLGGNASGISQLPQSINDDGVVVGGASVPGDLISRAVSWVAPNVPCVNDLTVSYVGGTLNIGFTVMTTVPATWSAWLAVPGPPERSAQLWSAPIPVVSPAETVNLPFPGFPAIGDLYVLTALTTPSGYCTDWKLIDTGP